MNKIEKIDEENAQFWQENIDNVEKGKMKIKEIIGFDIEQPSVFIPRVPCAYVTPSKNICETLDDSATSIYSLAPMYNSIIFPIFPDVFGENKITPSNFKETNSITIEDLLIFIEKGRIIPYFIRPYKEYDEKFVSLFLESGLPRISSHHMSLIRYYNVCKLHDGNCDECMKIYENAKVDMNIIKPDLKKAEYDSCTPCLTLAYSSGIESNKLKKMKAPSSSLCSIMDIFSSRNLQSIVKTNCPITKDSLNLFINKDISMLEEPIISGLRIKYSEELDLSSYLDILDSKTTRAVHEIINKISQDPYAIKYTERLNSKIYEFNKEIEEIGKSKTAKFYEAISDIAVYGGSKIVENQTQSYIKARKKDLNKVSEWIASKLMDIHATATGRDWTLAQLYRTKWKLDQCKKIET